LAAQTPVEIGKRGLVVQPLRAGDPAIGAGGQRRHHWSRARAGYLNEQRCSLLLASRAIWFGGSSIPNGRANLQRAMPVAKCKIVQPGLGDARGIDRIGSLALAAKIDDGSMRESDPERAERRRGGVHPPRNIVELAFADEWRGQKKSVVIEG